MNLEAIEQRCLVYLQNVQRPMVPIAELLAHVRADEDCADVDAAELLGFLRKHELFTVVDPQGLAAELEAQHDVVKAGFMNTPSVILTTRLPTETELKNALEQQMGTMLNALETAMNQARSENNPKLAMEVQAVLKRARALRQKMGDAGLTGSE